MTVSDLIALLAEFVPERRVVVDGYEGGLDDVIALCTVEIQADANQASDCPCGTNRI